MKHGGDLQKALSEQSEESLEDTLGDLRRYLILVEAWHVARTFPRKESSLEMCVCGHTIVQHPSSKDETSMPCEACQCHVWRRAAS